MERAARERLADRGARADPVFGLLIRSSVLPATRLVVPRLWLVPDVRLPRLEWRAEFDHETVTTADLLADFIKLADAVPGSIEDFGRQWGPLGVNTAGQPGPPDGSAPITAIERLWWEGGDQQREDLKAYLHGKTRFADEWWEPISSWHHVASRFRAILRMTMDRQDQRMSNTGDIEVVRLEPTGISAWFGREDPFSRRSHDHAPREGRDGGTDPEVTPDARPDEVLEQAVNTLIRAFPYRLRFASRSPGPPDLMVGIEDRDRDTATQPWAAYVHPAPSLFSTLVLQLGVAASWPLGLIQCTWCGNPYPQPAERSPRRDRAHFCSMSCRTEAKMKRDRDRARQRYAGRRSTADEPA